MATYKVTIQGMAGYKEFTDKHELRYWLMRYLIRENILGMNIIVLK